MRWKDMSKALNISDDRIYSGLRAEGISLQKKLSRRVKQFPYFVRKPSTWSGYIFNAPEETFIMSGALKPSTFSASIHGYVKSSGDKTVQRQGNTYLRYGTLIIFVAFQHKTCNGLYLLTIRRVE
jgi:hypothetical protein